MAISSATLTEIAPDQASLNAAKALLKPGKWPLRRQDAEARLVWGECQGSGANPYRVVFDAVDLGYKCSCPSRKFPCKHVLALMWFHAEEPGGFEHDAVPDWVQDWLGRRRKPAEGAPPERSLSAVGKSLAAAMEPAGKSKDLTDDARSRGAAEARAAATQTALLAAMSDLENWVADQLRTGLVGLLADLGPRCRTIAARMADGKAGALAGRLDELPGELMALPGPDRLDALVAHLGKLVILARAFRAEPGAPHLRRAVASAEDRDAVLDHADALRVNGVWEVAGERIRTRRDGLVSQASWLLNLGSTGPRFALLLDYFPASAGRRASAFVSGTQFEAELAFYPGGPPLRAIVVERKPLATGATWPAADQDPLASVAARETAAPWESVTPLLMGEGRIVSAGDGQPWWRGRTGLTLPIAAARGGPLAGMLLDRSAALWDGNRLSLLAAQTGWGRLACDA